MATRQLQAPSSSSALAHTLVVIGQMLLLMLVWAIFFLWALLATERLLIPWIGTSMAGQGFLNQFFTSFIGAYLPAFVVVLISLMLFFYRMPRSREKVSVPLEFALTIMLFIAVQLFVIGFALPWAMDCLPTVASLSFEQLLPFNLLPFQTCLSPGSGLIFTGLALLVLFWLQGSERLWQPLRQKLA